MESDDELLLVATLTIIKKKKKRKRKMWVQEIYKARETFGVRALANEMRMSNTQLYFKEVFCSL